MTTTDSKPWWQSVTIISSILGVMSGVFGGTAFGRVIEDPQAAQLIANSITGLAGLFAIWGRTRASKKVTT